MPTLQPIPVLGSPLVPLANLHQDREYATSRPLRRAAAAVLVMAVLLTLVQLLYPQNRALPMATFAGRRVGWLTADQLSTKLAPTNSQAFTARAVNATYEISFESIGLGLDTSYIAEQLTDYPLAQRFIPFSMFFYDAPVQSGKVAVADRAKLENFVKELAAGNNVSPVEGTILNHEGRLEVRQSVPGRSYNAQSLIAYFSGNGMEQFTAGATLPYAAELPVNDREHLASLLSRAQKIAQTDLTLVAGSVAVVVPGDAIVPAMRFDADPTTKKLLLNFDAQSLEAVLEDSADKVFVSPSSHSAGRELDRPASAAELARALSQDKKIAQAVIRGLPPSVRRLYPATSKGISLLIQDWSAAHPSLQLAVQFSEVGGLRRQAGLRAADRYFSASVYKSLVAWSLLKGVEEGRVNPDDVLAKGLALDGCLEQMIVISESVCSETAVYDMGGWKALDEFIAANGIQGINLSSGVSITANGMTQFLQKLNAGELISPDGTKKLLDLMKRQKYRQGVPAGSAGEVADKVGYMPWSYSWHDAAIVYHPKGTYTLVVLTRSGASLPKIAELARKISDTLDR